MLDPLFWLGLSLLLVAVSLTAVLIAALPAFREIARAARSAEKLFDTLRREFPPTLDAIRLTGLEISELTDDINEGVNSASGVVKQVDESLGSARQQAKNVGVKTQSAIAGVQAAWQTLNRSSTRVPTDRRLPSPKPSLESDDRRDFRLTRSSEDEKK
ncbi:DUF948 domain-containing protein [Spirulina sp. 06S082]|uniref:DUF948 domain-containing protein n=1 Tax=Spirulina sp. 06S082 TaxID=3110248 RepID=UPI002B2116C9|nr:DUF948 domain-containing protein [Spirulina sp. 06S082]MEA5467781.1 DUF948 domain-containing protein [Spirulina sp. 06S082]